MPVRPRVRAIEGMRGTVTLGARGSGGRVTAPTRWAYALFAALMGAGGVLRVLALRSTWGQPDADSAVSMLMALHASQGHLSLLYWGQDYGAAALAWIEAPIVAIFGLQLWIFYVVDAALMLASALLIRAIGSRFLTPMAAAVAGGTFWIFPALSLFWNSRDYLFYVPAVVFALATCLFVLQWFETRDGWRLWATGLSAGLGVWCFPLVLPIIAPPLLVLAWALRRDRGRAVARRVAGRCRHRAVARVLRGARPGRVAPARCGREPGDGARAHRHASVADRARGG